MVDKQAKTSLSLEPTSFKISFSNLKPSINKYNLEEWQTSWNNSIGNKLLDIKPTIGEYQSVAGNIRKEEVVLARLCLGHTRVTHPPAKSEGYSFGVVRPSICPSVRTFCLSGTISQYLLVRFYL